MIRFYFKRGLILIEVQERWELMRRLPSGKLQFQNETGEIKNLDEYEVLDKWNRQEWIIDISSIGAKENTFYLAIARDLSTYPERWQHIARRRERYVRELNPEICPYNIERWRGLIREIANKFGENHAPSPQAVLSWWRKYRNLRTINSLLPKQTTTRFEKRGGRFAIFEEVVSEFYLKKELPPKSDVFEAILLRITRLNQGKEEAEKIRPLSRATVYRWIDQLRQDVVDASRLGADAARVKYRMTLDTLKVDHVLARVEIDHTPLDVLVMDQGTLLPIGRPWLTLALDKYSRMVLGFFISFNPPSSYSVLQCLRSAILPKDHWLKRFPDIKGKWPAFGIPILIAVDNGMDLHSDALEKACQELGIQILFCPAATPQYKGSVERIFRTLEDGLIHKLPGTVFSNIGQRGDYQAEELAAIDFETLLRLVVKWIVDVYNMSRNRQIGFIPLEKWMDSISKVQVELPVDPKQLMVITGIPANRTLFHYGLELDGLHYNSRRLQEIRLKAGESLRLDLKFYEEDISYIHVFDKYVDEYIEVPAINMDYAAGLNRMVHRLIRSHARKIFGEQYSLLQLLEAKEDIQRIIQEAIKSKKMLSRKKGAGLMATDSETFINASNQENNATKSEVDTGPSGPSDLPEGLDDELPRFKDSKKDDDSGDEK